MTPEERQALDRRRRGRNRAMLGALIGLVVLFYLISLARMGGGG
jgi:hypothetical protein